MKRRLKLLLLAGTIWMLPLSAEGAVEIETSHIGNNEDIFFVKIPQIENKDQVEIISNLNDTFRMNVASRLESFEHDLESAPDLDIFDFLGEYEVPYNSDRYLSVVQSYYLFSADALENTYYDIGTYDLQTGRKITLHDIFAPQVDSSKLLTQIVREEIKAKGKTDYYIFFERVDPEVQFYLTEEGLVLLYPPHVIAPPAISSYEEGTIRFTILWMKIQSSLHPDFKLQ